MTALAIQIENAAKHYGDLRALDGVSLTIERSEFFSLLDLNGAGKTTLIGDYIVLEEILYGLREPGVKVQKMGGGAARSGGGVCADHGPGVKRQCEACGASHRLGCLWAPNARVNGSRIAPHPS